MTPTCLIRRIVLLTAVPVFLTGCLSVPRSPSPRFYVLQSIEKGAGEIENARTLDNTVIGIGPVALPEYLNRPQIVTTNSNGTAIEFAQFDRWAGPLDTEIARTICRNLSILLPKANLETFPWYSAIPIKYQVIMEIVHLECQIDREAALQVQWSIINSADKKTLFAKRSEYFAPLEERSYAGVVRAISSAFGAASYEIAQALTELPQ